MSAFDKVIGYESIKVELCIVSDIMRNPEKYHSLGVTTPKGILLHGEPGIGKTMMAKSLIEESGRKAFTIRKDKPDGCTFKRYTMLYVDKYEESYEETKEDAIKRCGTCPAYVMNVDVPECSEITEFAYLNVGGFIVNAS